MSKKGEALGPAFFVGWQPPVPGKGPNQHVDVGVACPDAHRAGGLFSRMPQWFRIAC
jgi:hypothetical protein